MACTRHAKGTAITSKNFISVILTTYKRLEYIRPCLLSIIQHTHVPVEFVIADGGSGIDFCKELWHTVGGIWQPLLIPQFMFPMAAIPATEAINRAFGIARGEYVMLANDDIEIETSDWAERMTHHIETNPDAGVIGTMTRNSYLKQNVGADYDCDAHIGETKPIDQVAGTFCYVNRRIWHELGGYDESFIGGGGDADYSIRVQAAGYKLLVAQDITVDHKQCRLAADKEAIREKYGVDSFDHRNIPHCINVAKGLSK